jgi:hypothetical protein
MLVVNKGPSIYILEGSYTRDFFSKKQILFLILDRIFVFVLWILYPNGVSISWSSILDCLFVFVVCLVYPMVPVSLDCPFLIIHASSSCVLCTQMVSVSLDCLLLIAPLSSSCVLCTQWCQFLLIVHSWLSMRLRSVSGVPKWCQCLLIVPLCSFCFLCCQMVSVSLDCTCVFEIWGYQMGNREQ